LRMALRNDEDHVCARSAQPPRVPVGRSFGGVQVVIVGEMQLLVN
jgi:hypothetical protein